MKRFFICLAIITVLSATTRAQTNFWWTNTVDGVWSIGANWTNNLADGTSPASGGAANYTLNFSNAGSTYNTTNDLGGSLLNRLNFASVAATLWGDSLVFVTDGVTAPQITQTGTSNVFINNSIVLSNDLAVSVAGRLTLVGSVSGPGGLTKSNSGTLTLANANTYTGLTIIANAVNNYLVLSNTTGSGNAIVGPLQIGSGSNQSAYLFLAANEQIADTTVVTFNGGSGYGRFCLLGYNETIGGLSAPTGGGVVENNDNLPIFTNAGPSTLTINVGSGSNFVYAGYLRNYYTTSGGPGPSNTLAVVKTGGGTQTFSGSYIGNGGLAGITVNNGFLVLTNTTSMSCGVLVNGGRLLLASATAMGTTARDVTNNAPNGLGFLSTNAFTIAGLYGSSSGSIALTNDTGAAVSLTIGGNNASGNFSGNITGLGGLTKIGTGTQTLSGSNSYDGITTVTAGMILVAHNNALGTTNGITAVTANNATVQLTNGITVTGETITLVGGGNNYGALQVSANSIGTWNGPILLNDTGGNFPRLGAATGGVLIVTGVITNGGSANLYISGQTGGTNGKVILANTNTYTGITGIIRGILALGADNALPTGTALQLNTANIGELSTFDLNGYNQTVASLSNSGATTNSLVTNTGGAIRTLTVNQSANTTYNGLINGNLRLVKDGTGALTLTGTNTATGGVTLNNGTLNLNNDSVLGTGTFIINGGTINNSSAGPLINYQDNAMNWNGDFTFAGTRSLDLGWGNVTLGGSRIVTVNGSTLTVGGAISDAGSGYSLTKNGPGALVLNGAATYSGGTVVNAGLLQFNNLIPATGPVTVNGGTLNLGGLYQFTSGTITFAGGTVESGVLSNNTAFLGQSGTITADLAGSAGLTKSTTGTLVLAGWNTYTGPTVLNAGVLQFNQINAIPASLTNLIVPAGTVLAAGFAMDNTFLGIVSPASSGTVALATSTSNDLDFNSPGLTNVSFGAVGGTWTYTGNLTPFGDTYRLGGGGGTLSLPNAGALTGSRSLRVVGPGVVSVSGTNDYTGGTIIEPGGWLFITQDRALGAVPGSYDPTNIILNGGTFAQTGDVTINTNRGMAIGSNGGTLTGGVLRYGGIISDLPGQTGVLYIVNFGTAYVPSGNSTYSGGTVLLSGGNVAIAGSNTVFGTGTITLLGGSIRTLTGASGSTNIVANPILFAADSAPGSGGGTLTFTGPITLTNGTRTLTVSQTTVIAGPIGEAAPGLGFTKAGTSRLIFTGTNTYTGPTTINAGTLTLGASALMNNTARFELLAGASLDVTAAGLTLGVQELKGSGTVLGNVTAGSGSQITPGNSVGALTITGNLTLQSGVLLNFELGPTNASDRVIVNNALNFSGMETNWFVLTTVSGFGAGEYTLFDAAAGTMSLGSGINFTNIGGSGLDGYLWLDDVNKDVKLTVVPEPSAGTLVGVGLLALLALRRWRQR